MSSYSNWKLLVLRCDFRIIFCLFFAAAVLDCLSLATSQPINSTGCMGKYSNAAKCAILLFVVRRVRTCLHHCMVKCGWRAIKSGRLIEACSDLEFAVFFRICCGRGRFASYPLSVRLSAQKIGCTNSNTAKHAVLLRCVLCKGVPENAYGRRASCEVIASKVIAFESFVRALFSPRWVASCWHVCC